MEISNNNNNNKYEYSSFSGSLLANQSQTSPVAIQSIPTESRDDDSAKTQPLNKSKKSLNSIVARLSNQSQPTASRQFMAALSLTERVTSPPQPASAYEVYRNQHVLAYEANHTQLPMVHEVNRGQPSPVYEMNPNQMQLSVCDDVALDLSLKKPTPTSHSIYSSDIHGRTDSVGALDLSSSTGQHSSGPESRKEPPDFVLDLTRSPAYPAGSGERNRHSITDAVRGKPSPSYTQNTQDLSRETFRENHRRVLQYLQRHTITQRIAGPDVDIELLTCRYCKYASTEKSSMMTHLSTAHSSRGRGSRHDKTKIPHRRDGGGKPQGQRAPSSLVVPQYKKRKLQQGVSPPSFPASSAHKKQFQQLSQLADDGSLTFFPTPSVNLSPLVKQVRTPPTVQSGPTLEFATSSTSQSPRKPTPSSKNGGSGEREYTLPANHVAYLGEDGRIYLLPHTSPGSTLEGRLTMSQSSGSPTAQTGAGGSNGATRIQSSGGSGLSAPADDLQRQLKLNHLCKKLAKRMDRQKNRTHPYGMLDQESGQVPPLKRRRKSATGKRQHLIDKKGTFPCEYCPKTFKRPLSLYGHLKQHSPLLKKHRKEGKVQCPACTLAFTNVQELLQHVRENHPTLSDLDSVRRGAAHAQHHTDPSLQRSPPPPPVEVNSLETGLQESGDGKDKPYSLRDKARRDYLLDNDPMMMGRLVNSVEHRSSQENDKTTRPQGSEPIKIDITPQASQCQTSEDTARKPRQRLRGTLGAVHTLLKLRHTLNKKKMMGQKKRSGRLGRTWKTMLRKSKARYNFRQLDKVIRSFTRTADGLRCDACNIAFRPPWKAVLHLKTSHLPSRKKRKGKQGSMKTAVPGKHRSPMAELSTGSDRLGKNLFVKIGEDEKYQCNLCLQMFQGKELLTDHLEMHKEIYEAGVQSFSENETQQDFGLNRGVDSTSEVPAVEETGVERSSQVQSGVGEETSSYTKDASPRKTGTVHHYVQQLRDKNATVTDQPNVSRDGSPGQMIKRKNGSPPRPVQPKSGGQMSSKSSPVHPRRLSCKICKFASFGMDEMKKHLKKHSKTLLTCDQCSYQTIEKRLIVRHIQTVHEQKRPYTCELCVYSTAYKHHLKRHYKSHSIDLLTCLKCSFCTLQEGKLREHMKEHDLSPNIVMCDDCGLTFVSSKILKEHLEETNHKLKSEERLPLENNKERSGFAANWWENLPMTAIDEEAIVEHCCCHTCGFITDSSEGLMSHMTSEHLETEQDTVINMEEGTTNVPHPQEEPTDILQISEEATEVPNTTKGTADVPRLKRKSPDTLPPQKRSPDIRHPQKRPTVAPRLKKETPDVPHLQRLNRLAMDLCQCPQCGFITSKDQLGAHLETHNSEETYACEHCPFETKELEALQSHKSKHIKHKVSLTCVLCGEVQTDVLSLRDHTRIHLITVGSDNPFKCSLCPFTTESMSEGEYHLNQHNYVMEFKCQVCMYSSPTLSGMTSHRKLHRRMHTSTYANKVRVINEKLSV